MHIPSGASQTVEVLDFETALSLSGQGDAYDRERWLYVPDFYTEYRYIFGTRGENPLICIGVNPSTAEPDDLDNTLKSVERIAAGNGYDSFIMFNVYAQRATRPDDMDRELDPRLHRANMDAFRYVLSGVGPGVAPRSGRPGARSSKSGPTCPPACGIWSRSGRTTARAGCARASAPKRGHPHHPLYLRKDEKTVDFDVRGYLDSLEASL